MSNALPPEEPTVGSLLRLLRRSFGATHLQCREARFVLCEVPLHADAVRALLPLGLRPAVPCLGTLFVVDYREPTFALPYREAALLIHVRSLFGAGLHCCWMVVDHDTPMIYGRETLGYPKKMAALTFEEDGDAVRATVTRRGRDLLSVEARKTTPLDAPPPIFGTTAYNVGGIGTLPGLSPIWRFRLTETIREAWQMEMHLQVEDSPYDPIHALLAGSPMNARMVVTDVAGTQTLLPVGMAGPRWLARTYALRVH